MKKNNIYLATKLYSFFDRQVSVVMYNSVIVEEVITSNEVNVDNTLSIKSSFIYILSVLVIISGFGLIFLQKRCYNK